jgi:hypothetical protein
MLRATQDHRRRLQRPPHGFRVDTDTRLLGPILGEAGPRPPGIGHSETTRADTDDLEQPGNIRRSHLPRRARPWSILAPLDPLGALAFAPVTDGRIAFADDLSHLGGSPPWCRGAEEHLRAGAHAPVLRCTIEGGERGELLRTEGRKRHGAPRMYLLPFVEIQNYFSVCT